MKRPVCPYGAAIPVRVPVSNILPINRLSRLTTNRNTSLYGSMFIICRAHGMDPDNGVQSDYISYRLLSITDQWAVEP